MPKKKNKRPSRPYLPVLLLPSLIRPPYKWPHGYADTPKRKNTNGLRSKKLFAHSAYILYVWKDGLCLCDDTFVEFLSLISEAERNYWLEGLEAFQKRNMIEWVNPAPKGLSPEQRRMKEKIFYKAKRQRHLMQSLNPVEDAL